MNLYQGSSESSSLPSFSANAASRGRGGGRMSRGRGNNGGRGRGNFNNNSSSGKQKVRWASTQHLNAGTGLMRTMSLKTRAPTSPIMVSMV
jgi:hypothetical protein